MNNSQLERYIRDFTGKLFSATNSEELYEKTLSLVGKYFNASFISVLLIEKNEDHFYIDFSNCVSSDYCQKPYSVFQTDIIRKCYGTGTPVYINKEDDNFVEVGREFFTSVEACFPLFFGGKMVGFFLFQDEDNPYDYEEEDNREFILEFLEILGSAIVSIKRIEAERSASAADHSKLNAVKLFCNLTEYTSEEEIFMHMMREIIESLKGEVASIQVVKKKKVESIAELGLPDAILEQISLGDGTQITKKVMEEGVPFFSIVDRDRIPLSIADEKVSISSLAVVPLLVDKKVVGIVNVVNYPEDISSAAIRNIETTANFASLALALKMKEKGKIPLPDASFFRSLRELL